MWYAKRRYRKMKCLINEKNFLPLNERRSEGKKKKRMKSMTDIEGLAASPVLTQETAGYDAFSQPRGFRTKDREPFR